MKIQSALWVMFLLFLGGVIYGMTFHPPKFEEPKIKPGVSSSIDLVPLPVETFKEPAYTDVLIGYGKPDPEAKSECGHLIIFMVSITRKDQQAKVCLKCLEQLLKERQK